MDSLKRRTQDFFLISLGLRLHLLQEGLSPNRSISIHNILTWASIIDEKTSDIPLCQGFSVENIFPTQPATIRWLATWSISLPPELISICSSYCKSLCFSFNYYSWVDVKYSACYLPMALHPRVWSPSRFCSIFVLKKPNLN